jgi:hypothetical protein
MTDMDFRSQLDQVKAAAGVADAEFALVSLHRYKAILQEIIKRFTTVRQGGLNELWWWNSFKEPKLAWPECPAMCTRVLRQLVPEHEPVWFVAEDWGRQKRHGNFWLYEGRIDSIAAVLDEAWSFEFYVVSKKFEWLLCQNHHDAMMAVGEPMVTHLKSLSIK